MLKTIFKKKYPLIILIIFILLAFLPFYISNGFIGDFGDPVGQTIPNKFLLIQYYKNGILPLLNPYIFLGFPFMADMQVGAFYLPDILLFSIFNPISAYNISILLHIIFLAFGTYLFTFKKTKNKIISISIALILALTAPVLSKITYLNFLEVLSFLPWILYLVTNKKIKISYITLIFTGMLLAGHPVAVFYNLIIIFLYILFNETNNTLKTIFAFLLSLIISAIQLIPFYYLKTISVRDSISYSEFLSGTLNFPDLLNFLSPLKQFSQNKFDFFIYMGIVPSLITILSIFYFHKFSKKDKRFYLSGILLVILGLLFSLSGQFEPIAKILYNLPIFNLIRVPARYFIFVHIGLVFMLIAFLKNILYSNPKLKNQKEISKKRQNLVRILSIFIITNSVLTPFLFLDRYEITDLKKEYAIDVNNFIEEKSLFDIPDYILSSSSILFPNRHIFAGIHSVIGYNPMMLKLYIDNFPLESVGAFSNPNYLIDLFDKFELIGLHYYIFPNEEYLKSKNLENKSYIIDFLKENNFEIIGEIFSKFYIFENKDHRDFIYFNNSENSLKIISFKPGNIELSLNIKEDDILIVNQIFMDGFYLEFKNINLKQIKAEKYQNLLQSYPLKKGDYEVSIIYKPSHIKTSFIISLFGIMIFLGILSFELKNSLKNKQTKK